MRSSQSRCGASACSRLGPGRSERQREPPGIPRAVSAKWLELLKEIVPGVTRAAVLRDPTAITGIGQFAVIQSVARSVGVEVSPLNLRDAGETERAVTAFARSSNAGLIVAASALASV